MLKELELSANKLAKSERESAWREMAKQVAHEIKNPLTPMKLSLQHLQRVIETNPTDIKERVSKLSAMLVEQIDSLSHIASEFSAFAKMPIPIMEKVNITSISENTVNLFSHEKNVEFSFTTKNAEAQWTLADKEQCQRVFSNLIKNAVQAIPENQLGKIIISTEIDHYAQKIIFKISDNGTGIPTDAIEKIFMPNFSTKSEGMGLGLAMVKNIIDSFGGTIQFTTKENVGTTFTLSFPLITSE